MWRTPPVTNASYVGRFAPPGRPKTTSTPSAFRHSITASTARILIDLLSAARDLKSQCTSGFFRAERVFPRRRAVCRRPPAPKRAAARPPLKSRRADSHANRQDDCPANRDDQKRGAHRDFEEAVAQPRDREQLDRDDEARHEQRLVDV